jgi:16S rRNA (cytosine967-C5)-methyltransferase
MSQRLPTPIYRGVIAALNDIFSAGRQADKVVEFNLKNQRKWGARDRRQFAEAVYEIVRHWRRLCLLSLGREPVPGGEAESDLEKILNFYLEGRGAGDAAAAADLTLAQRESIPDWLNDLCQSQVGERWPAMLAALNQQAPQFLRANTLLSTVESLKHDLEREGIPTELVPGVPTALRLVERKNVFRTKAFLAGFFEMQDAGSQMIAPMLQVEPGQRVVDACAGAGGKTLHLAALMKNRGQLVALDIHERKLQELKLRSRRAQVSCIETRWIESTKVVKRLYDSADRLLLDVPCSGLGVLRRHPDTKWKLKPEELERVAQSQIEILEKYTPIVKPGGLVVYATCSILPSENSGRVQEFLKSNSGRFELEEEWSVAPDASAFDGFYAARLRRID